MATRDEMERRLRRPLYFLLAVIVLGFVWSSLSVLGADSAEWLLVRALILIILAVCTIVAGILVTRFSLWQRDEYWRERGRDPKHPGRWQ
jgi:hypothetical protein